jgi:hypothetical protein
VQQSARNETNARTNVKNLPFHPTQIATLEIEQQNKKATIAVAFSVSRRPQLYRE